MEGRISRGFKGVGPLRPEIFGVLLYIRVQVLETVINFCMVIKEEERKIFTGSTTPLPWPKFLWHECWCWVRPRNQVVTVLARELVCSGFAWSSSTYGMLYRINLLGGHRIVDLFSLYTSARERSNTRQRQLPSTHTHTHTLFKHATDVHE